jgi:hypothetical protein
MSTSTAHRVQWHGAQTAKLLALVSKGSSGGDAIRAAAIPRRRSGNEPPAMVVTFSALRLLPDPPHPVVHDARRRRLLTGRGGQGNLEEVLRGSVVSKVGTGNLADRRLAWVDQPMEMSVEQDRELHHGYCPWRGSGPSTFVAVHTAKMHQVSGWQLLAAGKGRWSCAQARVAAGPPRPPGAFTEIFDGRRRGRRSAARRPPLAARSAKRSTGSCGDVWALESGGRRSRPPMG